MNDFNAALTRAFAEQHHEPAEDGFARRVAAAVARKERLKLWLLIAQGVGVAVAVSAVIWGLIAGFGVYGPGLMASLGLEIARAHGALTQAGAFNFAALAAAGMTQFMLIAGALAGAGMAYRNSQQP
jgi:hypothetical protein